MLSSEVGCEREKSIVRVSRSGEQTKFLGELYGLRTPLSPQLTENTAGVRFDRVLAYTQLFSDLAVAHALGYQFKDVKLAARDAEVLSFFLVRDERLHGGNKDLPNYDLLLSFCEPEAELGAKNRK